MLKIIVASNNPVKIDAIQKVFSAIFHDPLEINPISVPSGVSDQPMSDSETFEGALNRAKNARDLWTDGDYWVGIEGGVEWFDEKLAAFAWVVILSKTRMGSARTGTFFLPPQVAAYVRSGVELGHADDLVFGTTNSKQMNGAIGILTNDVITREELYRPAVIMAIIPFSKPDMFFGI